MLTATILPFASNWEVDALPEGSPHPLRWFVTITALLPFNLIRCAPSNWLLTNWDTAVKSSPDSASNFMIWKLTLAYTFDPTVVAECAPTCKLVIAYIKSPFTSISLIPAPTGNKPEAFELSPVPLYVDIGIGEFELFKSLTNIYPSKLGSDIKMAGWAVDVDELAWITLLPEIAMPPSPYVEEPNETLAGPDPTTGCTVNGPVPNCSMFPLSWYVLVSNIIPFTFPSAVIIK